MLSRSSADAWLPSVPGYTFRWSGPVLFVQTDGWRGRISDHIYDDAPRQALFRAIGDLQPRGLIVDLSGVEILPAICTHVLVRLAKEVDGVQHPGRFALINVCPAIVDYLRIVNLESLMGLQPTEAAALQRIQQVLAASQATGDGPQVTKYFSFANRDGVCVAAVQPGLFDWMPEIDTVASGPSYAELRGDFLAGWQTPNPSVLLDLRDAGLINHRTLNLAAQLCRLVTKAGGRIAVCGTAETVPVWQLCQFDKHIAPFLTELSEGFQALATGGERNDGSIP